MRRFVLSVILLTVAFGIGCATRPTGKYTSGLTVTMPAAGKSKVVFVRPVLFMGQAIVFGVHDGDRLIGTLNSGHFFQYECDPGYHLFSTSMEDVAMLEANLLPDRIYYAKVSADMGWMIAQVNMYSLHPGCAGNLWPKLPQILGATRESTLSPTRANRDREHADTYKQRIEKYLEYKYRPNPHREQILPEHGQTQPIAGP